MGGGAGRGKRGRNVGKENKWIDLKTLKDLVYFSLLEICAFFYLPFWEQGQVESAFGAEGGSCGCSFVNAPTVMHLETCLQMVRCGTVGSSFFP